jgi:hypothetical protein
MNGAGEAAAAAVVVVRRAVRAVRERARAPRARRALMGAAVAAETADILVVVEERAQKFLEGRALGREGSGERQRSVTPVRELPRDLRTGGCYGARRRGYG